MNTNDGAGIHFVKVTSLRQGNPQRRGGLRCHFMDLKRRKQTDDGKWLFFYDLFQVWIWRPNGVGRCIHTPAQTHQTTTLALIRKR